jgi:hypothetical protein
MTENHPVNAALDAFASAIKAELGQVAEQFPEDVAVAARTAEHLRVVLSASSDVTAEPWPPMQMGIAR